MKLLVMAQAYRRFGQEVGARAVTIATQPKRWDDRITVRSSDIMIAPSRRGNEQVLLFDEGEGVQLERVAEAINATIVSISFEELVSTLRREGQIPEGWPRPLW